MAHSNDTKHEKELRDIHRLIDDLTRPELMTLKEVHDFLESVMSGVEARIDGLRDDIINAE